MFSRWFLNRAFNAQPIAHNRNFAEGHAGLRHAKRTRVHAEKQHLLWLRREFVYVLRVRLSRVLQRIINMTDRLRETQAIYRAYEIAGGDEHRRVRRISC